LNFLRDLAIPVGHLVLLYSPSHAVVKQRKLGAETEVLNSSRKITMKYDGPYMVTKQLSPVVYEIECLFSQEIQQVNVARLRSYHPFKGLASVGKVRSFDSSLSLFEGNDSFLDDYDFEFIWNDLHYDVASDTSSTADLSTLLHHWPTSSSDVFFEILLDDLVLIDEDFLFFDEDIKF
jgi:hypothetical protein